MQVQRRHQKRTLVETRVETLADSSELLLASSRHQRANYLAQRSPVSVQPIENRMASKGGSEGSSGGMADVGAVFAPAQTQSEIDLVERSAQESLLERRRGWSTGNLEKESLLCVRAPLFYI